jgi:release factor glutamine methyltransferase
MTNEMIAKQLRDAGIEDYAKEADEILAAAPSPEVIAEWVARRGSGEPLGLIVGSVRFMGLGFRVTPGTLVPRPETELVTEAALRELDGGAAPAKNAIDMCCGVGNIGVVLAARRPGLRVWLSDLTEACVHAAEMNISSHGLSDRVTVKRGDLFEPLRGMGLEGSIDLITCNPPYISTSRLAGERANLLRCEPREAFDAGPYGVTIHQRVIKDAPQFLRPGGCLAFEFGVGQAGQMRMLFLRSGRYRDIQMIKDAAGQERAVLARYENGDEASV